MSDAEADPFRASLARHVGQSVAPPAVVNVRMVQHWPDTFGDRDRVDLDEDAAPASRHVELPA